MLNVKALEKEVRRDFLDDPLFVQKLLLSGKLHSSLESKLWFSNNSWGIPNVPLLLSWSPHGFIARTNDSEIQINVGNDYFSDDVKERYYQVFGAAAHENAHRRYTNFQAMVEYAKNMEKGLTAIPKGDKDDEKRMKELLKNAPKSLSMIVFKMHNAIEDGRIEELFIRIDKNFRTLWEGLVKLREHTYMHHSPSYDILMDQVASGMPVFLAIEQMLLTYGRFGKVNGLPSSGEIPEVLSKVFPLIDHFKAEENMDIRLELLTKMTMLLSEYIMDYLSGDSSSSQDSSEDQSEDSGDGQGNSQSSSDGSQDNSQSGSQGSSQDGSQDDSQGSSQDGSQGNSKGNNLDGFDDSKASDKVKEDQDKMSGTTELPDCNSSGNEEFGEPTEGPETNESPDFDEIKEGALQEEIEKRAEDIIQDALDEMVRKSAEELNTSRIRVARPAVTEGDKATYRRIVAENEMAIKKAIKLSTFKFEQDPYLAKNRYFGTRFNADKVATGNFKTFSKVIRPPEKSGLRVVLNVDESGSMSGMRIHYARYAAIIVYEYCKRMEIPIDIIGFDTDIRNYVDSDYPSEKDGPRLTRLTDNGGTIDDVPLEVARMKLNKHPESKKLILVISDGAGCYSSTKAIAKDCVRENIAILTAAIGGDKELLEDIYGRDSFMDIQDLSKLPQVLVKKIKSMLY